MSFHVIPIEEIEAIMRTAIAEGRHCPIEQWRTICGGCGQWVDAIWYTTTAKERLCAECADEIGQGPKALIQHQQQIVRLYAPTGI